MNWLYRTATIDKQSDDELMDGLNYSHKSQHRLLNSVLLWTVSVVGIVSEGQPQISYRRPPGSKAGINETKLKKFEERNFFTFKLLLRNNDRNRILRMISRDWPIDRWKVIWPNFFFEKMSFDWKFILPTGQLTCFFFRKNIHSNFFWSKFVEKRSNARSWISATVLVEYHPSWPIFDPWLDFSAPIWVKSGQFGKFSANLDDIRPKSVAEI
jgi:hypothetical protein